MELLELETRFDGPIPRTLRRNARRHPPAPRGTFRATVRICTLNPAFVVPAMADTLIQAFDRAGTATEKDLYLAGYSPDTIRRHGPAARKAALDQLAQQGRAPSDPEAA